MKELMLGNKAVARGLYEAGCGVISSYPGTPSTEMKRSPWRWPTGPPWGACARPAA